MADFYQNGIVATLQNISKRPLEDLEAEISRYAKRRPVALILPALYMEFKSGAMDRIINELRNATYIKRVVLSLDRAGPEEFRDARETLSVLPQEVDILWNDGPGMKEMYDLLRERGLLPVEQGKGRGVWAAIGYILARGDTRMVATHDCDIVNYERGMLARLVYPVVNAGLEYEFSKGYYARVSDKLYGRVVRLFFGPLVRSLKRILGYTPYLRYIDSFRYPLAGEFAMTRDLLKAIRFPGDWGLEVGILSQVFQNTALSRVAQVEIADIYEHKHQKVSRSNSSDGLMRMCIDITRTLLRFIAQTGFVFPGRFYKTLKITYLREAYDAVDKYEALAAFNGIPYDRHHETLHVEAFSEALEMGMGEFEMHPVGSPYLPPWSRVVSAIPDFLDIYVEAVARDNAP